MNLWLRMITLPNADQFLANKILRKSDKFKIGHLR